MLLSINLLIFNFQSSTDKDDEFTVSDSASDDEETMKEQEEIEQVDHKKEIEDLQVGHLSLLPPQCSENVVF